MKDLEATNPGNTPVKVPYLIRLNTDETVTAQEVTDDLSVNPDALMEGILSLYKSGKKRELAIRHSEEFGTDLTPEERTLIDTEAMTLPSADNEGYDDWARGHLYIHGRLVKTRLQMFQKRNALSQAFNHVRTPEQLTTLFSTSLGEADGFKFVSSMVAGAAQAASLDSKNYLIKSVMKSFLRVGKSADLEQRSQMVDMMTDTFTDLGKHDAEGRVATTVEKSLLEEDLENPEVIDLVSELTLSGLLEPQSIIAFAEKYYVPGHPGRSGLGLLVASFEKARNRGELDAFIAGMNKRDDLTRVSLGVIKRELSRIAPPQFVKTLNEQGRSDASVSRPDESIEWPIPVIIKVANSLAQGMNANAHKGEEHLPLLVMGTGSLGAATAYIAKAIKISNHDADITGAEDLATLLDGMFEITTVKNQIQNAKPLGKAATSTSLKTPNPADERVQQVRRTKGTRKGPYAPRKPGGGLIS